METRFLVIILISFCYTMFADAQDSLYVKLNNNTIEKMAVAKVDSFMFNADLDSFYFYHSEEGFRKEAFVDVDSILFEMPVLTPLLEVIYATERADEVIELQMSGAVQEFSGEESNFMIHVVNGLFDQNITVSNAAVKEGDPSVIELTLSAPIYNTDVIKVSYFGKVLLTFTNETVEMFVVDLCVDKDIYGFEIGSLVSFEKLWDSALNAEVTVTDEKSYSGDYSIKIVGKRGPNINDKITPPEIGGPMDDLTLKLGAVYRYSYKCFRPSGEDNLNGISSFLMSSNPWSMFGISSAWTTMPTRDEWVTISADFEFLPGGNSADPVRRIQIKVPTKETTGNDVTLYIDDISLLELEPRP